MKILLISTIIILTISSLRLYANLYIDGEFNGWEGETVVKLSDGSFWIESSYYYYYCYSFNPEVNLINDQGQIKMIIKGCCDVAIPVQQITDVIESRINGTFEGFDDGKIFLLQNGTVWKQIKYKYWYKYAYNPKCIVYNHSGWKLSIFGRTIDVERIK
ncbi:MAG: hypothetical protein HZB41_06315 [Ignavibacteriae bacterium]|nr:hypothetical protein [Ignavibacteriota bacterium]